MTTPTIGRVLLVKWTPNPNGSRLMGMEEERSGRVVALTATSVLVNVDVPISTAAVPVIQVEVPLEEGAVSGDGLSWRWPPRA